MPRAVKTKTAIAVSTPAAKKGALGVKKNSKLYDMPEKIAEGTVLSDLAKGQWRIGPSIGTGGFGEIYSACRVGEKNYDYVVKCEPHGNGPLFVEMHFYMRNARREDIEKFKRERGMKSLGMPYMLGNGSADINGQKHRFIVMPRYGSDVAKHYKANGNRLPEGTVYRLAIQMLEVYEFVHSCGYVHADLKGANILLGLGKAGAAQAFLVDYGLASHYTTKEFKPDPKKMHNGTIEYTSRDAHQGVATMRADLEILGYNLIEWLGVQLPWVRDKLLVPPTKAQKAKESFMSDVSSELKKLFPKGVPVALAEFMKYVGKMAYNEAPDYGKCRNIFSTALKQLKISQSGDLDFKIKSSSNNNSYVEEPIARKKEAISAATTKPRTKQPVKYSDSDSDDVICASDDDDEDVVFETRKVGKTKPMQKLKTSKVNRNKNMTPVRNRSPKIQNKKMVASHTPPSSSPRRSILRSAKTPSPRKRLSTTGQSSPVQKKRKENGTPEDARATAAGSAHARRNTPQATSGPSAKINFSPAISLRSSCPGKTIINDNLTPNLRSNKTYEFNFELDVSMDANVIVNVKRKKKAAAAKQSTHTPRSDLHSPADAAKDGDTPVTRVKVRKMANGDGDTSSLSPHTPAVTLRKYRH